MRWMMRMALVGLLGASAGCMHYRPAAVPSPGPSGWRPIGHARVTTTESRHYMLRDVSVTADSLVGFEPARDPAVRHMRRIALHRGEIRRLERFRIAPFRSILLGIVAVYGVLAYIGLRSMGG
jgi:hypothetical protein